MDLALAVCLFIMAVQLVPLAPGLRLALSPASAALDRALYLNAPLDPAQGQARPLSFDPTATLWALALGAAVVLLFWSARALFERQSSLRVVSRGIVWFGLVVSAIAFVQHALTPRLIYGFWKPITQTNVPLPYGPYVNRNDLATWLILAVPTACGYFMARLGSRPGLSATADIEEVVDARAVWLIASACLMLALVLASTSRSGMVGIGFGLLTLVGLSRRRVSGKHFWWMIAGLILVGLAAATYADIGIITSKFGEALGSDFGRGRVSIWRNSWRMARDFWQTGVGVGAFGRGMMVYQEMPRTVFFNHAHNQYLQFFAEGGLPLALASGAAMLGALAEIRRRLRSDRTSVFWIRAGAASGMAAVAVQSLWDAGLRMPANAVLFAIVAAMATHESSTSASSHHAPR